MLGESVVSIHQGPDRAWPLGFALLRRVDVGSDTRFRDDNLYWTVSHVELGPLFLLPNLEVLNMTAVVGDRNATLDFDIAPCSSNIKELGFSCCELYKKDLRTFLRAPKHLHKLALYLMNSGGPLVSECLEKQHATTLMGISANAVPVYEPGKFVNLQVCDSLSVEQLVLPYHNSIERYLISDWPHLDVPGYRDTAVLDLRAVLPPTVEKLRLSPQGYVEWNHDPAVIEHLFAMLADLAEDPRFVMLSEICIFDMKEMETFKEDIESLPSDSVYGRAVARLKSRGTGLHELCTKEEHDKLHPALTGLGTIATHP
jgi:hypothetical protein